MVPPSPRPGVRPQEFGGRAAAAEWIVAEQYLLPELVRSIGHDPRGETFRRQLTSALEMCLHSTGFWAASGRTTLRSLRRALW
ncbi:hypothetical protein [Streptomyces sp. NPDC001530]|uniref:hypothetical protein n=1 Tax=Streptomyces sp. NPDC001530 TaxID=3364582 RepID=UPI0036B21900